MPLRVAYTNEYGIVNEHILFEAQSYLLGRSEEADIRFGNPQVSRRHASLEIQADGFWHLTNLGSSGCFFQGRAVNDLTVEQERVVRMGPVGLRLAPYSSDALVKAESYVQWRKNQLARLQSRISSCQDSQTLVDLAREALCQALGCERASLLILNENQDIDAAMGHEAWMNGADFSGSRTMIRRALSEQNIVAIGDIGSDQELSVADSIVRHGIKAAVAVPVEVDGHVAAVLYGDAIQSRSYFTTTDIDMVKSLVNLLSLRLLYQTIETKIAMVH